MENLAKRVIQIVGGLLVLLTLMLLIQIDSLVLQCTEAFFPNSGAIVCCGLIVLEIIAFGVIYKAFFARPSKLVLNLAATSAERAAFRAELLQRFKTNPCLKGLGLNPSDPYYLTKAMNHLDSLAEEEIRSHGKKVFLGTALSQNGRLDALIMFFALARMIYRVSKIYNQKPTPKEMWSVLSTVSSSTFVAFSIEALNIPQTITDTMNELMPSVAPAVAASGMPLVGQALHVFTASLIDGAANCLLAVRAGVITRRAYTYALNGGEESLRSSCVRETGAIMLDISKESLTQVVKVLKQEIQDLSVDSSKKMLSKASQAVTDLSKSCGNKVKEGADLVCNTSKSVAYATVNGLNLGAKQLANCAKNGAENCTIGVVNIAKNSKQLVENSVTITLDTVHNSAVSLGSCALKASDFTKEKVGNCALGVKNTVDTTLETVRNSAESLGQAAVKVSGLAKDAVGNLARSSVERVGESTEAIISQVKNVGQSARQTVRAASEVVQTKKAQAKSLLQSFSPFKKKIVKDEQSLV